MKLHRLEIEGFGPFLRRQVIDFDEYDADGLFLISGKTGAGKSSLLDAVCFALYASVPRYNSSGGKRVRSDHALPDDPSEVSLTFSTGEATYRVTRSPEYERPKQRGGGMTTQASTVQLDRWDGKQWVGLASRAVDAAHQLAEILQLNKEQFLQVILLAQNRFAQFLLADSNVRQGLLRTLFGTRRFEDYQRQLNERRKTSEQTMAAARARLLDRLSDAEKLVETHGWGDQHVVVSDAEASSLGNTSDVSDDASAGETGDSVRAGDETAPNPAHIDTTLLPVAERLEHLHRARERGDYRVQTTIDAADRADAARIATASEAATKRTQREHQTRRDTTRAELVRLEERALAIAADRAELAAAREAQTVMSSIAAATRDALAATNAAEKVAAARERWGAYAPTDSPALSLPELRALVDHRTTTLGALASAAALEQAISQHEAAAAAAVQALADAESARASLREEADRIPTELAALDVTLAQLQTRIDRLDDLRTNQTALAIQLGAALQLAGHEKEHERALHAAAEANKAARSSADALDALYQRKLEGSASELAATLTDDSPCPVCGSTAHPQPAPTLVDPVTDADLAAVTAERDARQREATAASEAEQRAATALAQMMAAAGGQSLESLIEAEQKLADDIADAEAAQTERDKATGVRDELREREKTMAAAIEAASATVATALAQRAAAEEKVRAATDVIAAARDEWESVVARIAAITAERDTAQVLVTALDDAERADAAVVASRTAQETALEATTCATAEAAQEASRSADQIAALDARIAEHDIIVRSAKATLMELELEVLPDEPIDVDSAVAVAEAAQQEWARIGSELTALRGAVAALTERTAAAEEEQASQEEALIAHETIVRLADTVSGHEPNTKRMSLETFILAAELEQIVGTANVRLADMSNGRYRLQHSDERVGNAAAGLGINIFDTFTSKARPAHSLSGGETFLASLALALGLAEVVTNRAGGVRLDTLFIDEGFGSLDPETLQTAMQTLDELRSGGRTVGIISHVEAMKEEIPAQLRVEVASDGSSDIITR